MLFDLDEPHRARRERPRVGPLRREADARFRVERL
jgi:hypothetical protein